MMSVDFFYRAGGFLNEALNDWLQMFHRFADGRQSKGEHLRGFVKVKSNKAVCFWGFYFLFLLLLQIHRIRGRKTRWLGQITGANRSCPPWLICSLLLSGANGCSSFSFGELSIYCEVNLVSRVKC